MSTEWEVVIFGVTVPMIVFYFMVALKLDKIAERLERIDSVVETLRVMYASLDRMANAAASRERVLNSIFRGISDVHQELRDRLEKR